MAQFDVYGRRGGPGFLLDYQADVFSPLATRFVVPLLPRSSMTTVFARLNPTFVISGKEVILMPQNAATVLARELDQWVTTLETERYVIMNAIDFLTGGY